MTHLQEEDFHKLKELLQYTSEFIAYFELADTKMLQWRQEIEQENQNQHQLIQQQLQNLHHELDSLVEALTQVGIERLRLKIEQALKQGETHVQELQKTGKKLLGEIQAQQQTLRNTQDQAMTLLSDHTEQSLIRIDRYLANYDIHHFRRAASESHLQVEKVSENAIKKSMGILKLFQWRATALALTTTIITSVLVSAYVTNELPWETHVKAMNERQAGKVLMQAWSSLTQQEKNKILNQQTVDNNRS